MRSDTNVFPYRSPVTLNNNTKKRNSIDLSQPAEPKIPVINIYTILFEVQVAVPFHQLAGREKTPPTQVQTAVHHPWFRGGWRHYLCQVCHSSMMFFPHREFIKDTIIDGKNGRDLSKACPTARHWSLTNVTVPQLPHKTGGNAAIIFGCHVVLLKSDERGMRGDSIFSCEYLSFGINL
ncbi:hypothetical protein CDAR_87371 [Caerostris darwini]|uniref:Uncharacterized protein n=1 Tax=Caerostris darwini TaxID=1538125 RepID=A0AAV4U802_9ARAC|nr:hypothetical protein CDAR_87371 [Caerostris darwini]